MKSFFDYNFVALGKELLGETIITFLEAQKKLSLLNLFFNDPTLMFSKS